MLLNIIFSIILMVGTNPVQKEQNELILTVENIKNSDGVIRVLLFKGPEGFPDQYQLAFQNASIKIIKNKAVYTFINLPEGIYAISLFHDSQNTGKLRTNTFGIPKDGYGFSNNTSGIIGPPSYDKASFKLASGVNQINIKLK